MRKLKLYNYDMTSSLDLNSNKYLVDDMTGFGTGYKLIGEGSAIHDIEVEFENITLRINFGINDNAYNCYKEFMDLVILNGKNKLILGYDYNGSPRYCDIYLQNAPKTQKTNFNIITETFVFKRMTPWYEIIIITTGINNHNINNTHLIPINLVVESNQQTGGMTLYLEKNETYISQITVVFKSGYTLKIDSEIKEAAFVSGSTKISAYDNINHMYDSFFWVPTGIHKFIDVSGAVSKLSYKKWVAD